MYHFTSESSIWSLFCSQGSCSHPCAYNTEVDSLSTYLYCSGSSRGAGSDLEQARFCRCCLASFPRGSTLVNNQGLSTKHTHQMRWLFSLHYSFLEKKKLAVSFKLLLKSSTRYTRKGLYNHLSSWNIPSWLQELSYCLPQKSRPVFKLNSHNCHFILIAEWSTGTEVTSNSRKKPSVSYRPFVKLPCIIAGMQVRHTATP